MNCEQAKTRWHAAFDDGLVDPALQSHLETCASCRRYAEEMSQLACVLDELRIETEQITSVDAAGDSFVPASSSRPAIIRIARAGLAMAACIGLVAVGTVYFRDAALPGPDAQPPATQFVVPIVSASLELRGETAEHYLAVVEPGVDGEPVDVIWLFPTIGGSTQDGGS